MALTQARGFGAFSGGRYGSFAGRGASPGGPHPVGSLTHARAFGAFSGGRYGAFGRGGAAPPVIFLAGGRARVPVPDDLRERIRRQLADEDEVLAMVLIAAMPGLLRRH